MFFFTHNYVCAVSTRRTTLPFDWKNRSSSSTFRSCRMSLRNTTQRISVSPWARVGRTRLKSGSQGPWTFRSFRMSWRRFWEPGNTRNIWRSSSPRWVRWTPSCNHTGFSPKTAIIGINIAFFPFDFIMDLFVPWIKLLLFIFALPNIVVTIPSPFSVFFSLPKLDMFTVICCHSCKNVASETALQNCINTIMRW